MLMYRLLGSFLKDWRKRAAPESGGSVEIFSKLTFKSIYSFLILPSTASYRKHCYQSITRQFKRWIWCFLTQEIESFDSVINTSKSGSELDLFRIPLTFWDTFCAVLSGTGSREKSVETLPRSGRDVRRTSLVTARRGAIREKSGRAGRGPPGRRHSSGPIGVSRVLWATVHLAWLIALWYPESMSRCCPKASLTTIGGKEGRLVEPAFTDILFLIPLAEMSSVIPTADTLERETYNK